MTKRTQLFLAALVLVAILAHGYIYWWAHNDDHGIFDSIPFVKTTSDSLVESYPLAKPTPTIKPKPQTPAAPAAEINEYEDSTLRFTLMYPSTWTHGRTFIDDKTTICMNETGWAGGCQITITAIEEAAGVNEITMTEQLEAEYKDRKAKVSTKTVGGEEAKLFAAADGSRTAIFTHNKVVYTIEGVTGQEAIFDRAISTFKFF